jgi:hypothetical protein
MVHDQAELFDLASKLHDDCLAPEELARLNALLKEEEARRDFVDFAQIHYCLTVSELSEDCRSLASSIGAVHRTIIPDSAISDSAATSAQPITPTLDPTPMMLHDGQVKRARRRVLIAVLATCAGLLIALQVIQWKLPLRPVAAPTTSLPVVVPKVETVETQVAVENQATENVPAGARADFVARIVAAANGVTWAPQGAPSDFLLRLGAGERIRLKQGLLKVEFSGGAVIILSGPADLEVLSAHSARLFAGSLTGRCDTGEFTLHTPQAEVIDVGTEFGVSVERSSDTKVAVFEGEVHVKSLSGEPARTSVFRLTRGMSVRIDEQGMMESGPVVEQLNFQRELPAASPVNLGIGEVSLVDVICGSGAGEYRIAGAIDPLSGDWGTRPWTQPKGVELRSGEGQFVRVDWNPLVDGLFVPPAVESRCQADSHGNAILLPGCSGATWGPVWARRRIHVDLDPFSHRLDQDDEGFWGAGTITAMLDRLRWARDGLVGLHANIGITIDLEALRRQRSGKVSRLRGIVTLLERSHVSQPFLPKSLADFRVYVDGKERYQRLKFSREDGDAQFGATIDDADRYLTLVVTDSGDGNLFDRVILIDPVLELSFDNGE